MKSYNTLALFLGILFYSFGAFESEAQGLPEAERNWIQVQEFDADSRTIAEEKTYYENNGKPMQRQYKDLSTGQVLATEHRRDAYDRDAIQTLPAAIQQGDFHYKEGFMSTTDEAPYAISDFGHAGHPARPIGNGGPGTLGWYYSADNTLVPETPATRYPFARTEYDEARGGMVHKRNTVPGDAHYLGSGHEEKTAGFDVGEEFAHYSSLMRKYFGHRLYERILLGGNARQELRRDANGRLQGRVTDAKGNVIITFSEGNTLPLAVKLVPADNMDRFYLCESTELQVKLLPGAAEGRLLVRDLMSGAEKIDQRLTSARPRHTVRLEKGLYGLALDRAELSYTHHVGSVAYHFYDIKGQLLASIAPNGLRDLMDKGLDTYGKLSDLPFTNHYRYDQQGRLLSLSEPDAGRTEYRYRRDGNIRFSQNAEQRKAHRYSYTHYDALGRVTLSGEFDAKDRPAFRFDKAGARPQLLESIAPDGGLPNSGRDWVKTYYDVPEEHFHTDTRLPDTYVQEFVMGAVSCTENEYARTWYSYDELGRVVWTAQQPKGLERTFVLAYSYDFQGNVLQSSLRSYDAQGQDIPHEQFHHHFDYDADQRLRRVYTSRDGNRATATEQAHYSYYLHGPLKRIELAGNLQGIDFTYTAQGWLKSINDPAMDEDGDNGFRKDAFSLLLHYHKNSRAESLRLGQYRGQGSQQRHDVPWNSYKAPLRLAEAFHSLRPSIKSSGRQWREQWPLRPEEQQEGQPIALAARGAGLYLPLTIAGPSQRWEATRDNGKEEVMNRVPDALELVALRRLFAATKGGEWENKEGWPALAHWPRSVTATEMGTWFGVTEENGDIVGLQLSGNHLVGTLPDLSALRALKELKLGSNELSGTLSSWIGDLKELRVLALDGNRLTGGIPSALGRATALEELYLRGNPLGGGIPAALGRLRQLSVLEISDAELGGPLPAALSELGELIFIGLQHNRLEGPLPDMSQWKKMQFIFLNNNRFVGSIPRSIVATKEKLILLQLSHNRLSGKIPEVLNQVSGLFQAFLDHNDFEEMAILKGHPNANRLELRIGNNRLELADIAAQLTGPDGGHVFRSFEYLEQAAPVKVKALDFSEGQTWMKHTIADRHRGHHYQWQKWEQGAWKAVPGAKGATLSLRKPELIENARYRCRVENTWLEVVRISEELVLVKDDLPPAGDRRPQDLYDGSISAMAWRTEPVHRTGGTDTTGLYFFDYDEKYQLKEALWGRPELNFKGYTRGGNRYRVTGLDYDPNGNLLQLRRYGADSVRKHRLRYHYGTANRLRSIDDHATYGYDALGRLIVEKPREGEGKYIKYDVMGKVKAVYADAAKREQKLSFLYDERGFRLMKKDHRNRTETWYVRDAAGRLLSTYEKRAANPPQQTELMVHGLERLGLYRPQESAVLYELSDHLGNARALLRKETLVYEASMEAGNAAVEEHFFERLDTRSAVAPGLNATAPAYSDASPKAARLNAFRGEKVGPAKTLVLEAGERVLCSVMAAYVPPETVNGQSKASGSTAAQLAAVFGGTKPIGEGQRQVLTDLHRALAGSVLGRAGMEEAPKAGLNYIFVPHAKSGEVHMGFAPIGKAAARPLGQVPEGTMEKLGLNYTAKVPGTLYIYVAAEGSEDVDYYFDELRIAHEQARVVRSTDYYPFGSVQRTVSTSDTRQYRFGYQGQFAEYDTLTGWNHFDLREYDPVIGRFTQTDPMGQYWSPYVGMGNSPVMGVDPTGGTCETCPETSEYDDYRDSNLDYAYSSLVSGDGAYQMLAEVEVLSEPGMLFTNAIRSGQESFYNHPVTQATMLLAGGFIGAETFLLARAAQGLKAGASAAKLGAKALSAAETAGEVARGGTTGFKSLGAAGKGFSKTLQTGGHTLNKSTLKALNLSKQQGKIAIEGLKKDIGLPPNFHGKIMGNGDLVHPNSGQVLGNLFDYLY